MRFAGLAGYERAYMRFLILLCVASISYGMENQEKGIVEGARTSVINPLQGWKNILRATLHRHLNKRLLCEEIYKRALIPSIANQRAGHVSITIGER